MSRKRLTQIFPFLTPLRINQRKLFFYLGMRFDKNHYAIEKSNDKLPYQIYKGQSLMLNENSGFDIQYQINKVHNLKLASSTVDGLILRPKETFSFWQLVKNAEKYDSYKDGLVLANGKITTVSGGGLCQLSNLLFWLFLHTPLTIIERHSHAVESFPLPPSDVPEGVYATVHEGWLDLKFKNDTDSTFQVAISFDERNINGYILADKKSLFRYEISSKDLCYFRRGGRVFQKNSIYRAKIDNTTNKEVENILLYNYQCEIGYELPDNINVIEIGV